MVWESTLHLLHQAQRGKYAVPHFNINNLEILQAVVRAAERQHSPLIVATSEGAIAYAEMEYLYALVRTAAERSRIPIALHLDHGHDPALIRKAIQLGYSSVMIDASPESFKMNVQRTKKIVAWAHQKHIAVEAELGTIGGAEDTVSSRKIRYTDPYLAQEFVERTGCDFLAIAIGTSHGAYKFRGRSHLRLDLLQQIRQKVKIPLVLHGASSIPSPLVKQAQRYGAKLEGVQGVPPQQLRAAIRLGITKINTDTDLRLAFDVGVRKALHLHPNDIDPRHLLAPARELMQQVAEQRIKLFGSGGKA